MNDGNATNLTVGRPRPAGVLDSERLCFALPRDRLGYFEVVPDPRPNLLPSEDTHQLYWREHIGDMVPEYAEPHCISCPIDLRGASPSVYVNSQGMSPQNRLTVELLDERMRPLPGYGRADCLPVVDGLRTPVALEGSAVPGGDRLSRAGADQLGVRAFRRRVPVRGVRGE